MHGTGLLTVDGSLTTKAVGPIPLKLNFAVLGDHLGVEPVGMAGMP